MRSVSFVMILALAFTGLVLVAPAPVASAGCEPVDSFCVLWCPPPPSTMACQIRAPLGPS